MYKIDMEVGGDIEGIWREGKGIKEDNGGY